jgi:hypothetical protein
VSLLQPLAIILLSVGSILIFRAVLLSESRPRPERRVRRARKAAYDASLRRVA